MDEESSCFPAKNINVVWAGPIRWKAIITSALGDFGKPTFQEQLDVAVHQRGLDLMELEHICVRPK